MRDNPRDVGAPRRSFFDELCSLAMEATGFDEADFFRAIEQSGARALLIGRRALVVLGAPLLTADYDFWLHRDDIDALNSALAALELRPSRSPDEARARGRYVIEGAEHVDVLVARAATTKDGVTLAFDEAWERRQRVAYSESVSLSLPSIRDLILTKRWAMRERDLPDILFLEKLLERDRR